MGRRDIDATAATAPPDLAPLDGAPAAAQRHAFASFVTERVLLVAGCTLFVLLVYQMGFDALAANLRLVGAGITLVIAQEILAYAANTLGWWAAFPRPRPALRFTRLLAARIAGDAVNYVTPTATLGGEVVRVSLMRGQAAMIDVGASVAVAKLAQTLAQLLFVVAGLAILADEIPFEGVGRVALVAAVSALGLCVAIVVMARRGSLFVRLVRIADALQRRALPATWTRRLDAERRLTAWDSRARRLDDAIARSHGANGGPLLLSTGFFLVGWVDGIVEVYLILWLLGIAPSVRLAATIEVLSVAVDACLFFMPAKLGTQEGGKVLIFTLLGLDPGKGLALGMVRRIREIVWTLAGLVTLWRGRARANRGAR